MNRLSLSKIMALRDEHPAKLMRLLRLAWPDIKAALQRGHTLRMVHSRPLESGIDIELRPAGVLRPEAAS